MDLYEMQQIVSMVSCLDYTFQILSSGMRCPYHYLQGSYDELDVDTGASATQKTRKWLLSKHMTKSELIQTALKCALTSAEHRIREHFRYQGELVYGPHFDVDALVELARAKRLDVRPDPPSRET